MHSQLLELQKDYIEKLPKKINLVNEIWQKLTYLSWNDDAFSSFYRLIHGLTGSGKTFGLDQLSDDSREFEDYLLPLLDSHRVPTEKQRNHIDSLVKKLAGSVNIKNEATYNLTIHNTVSAPGDYCKNKTIYIIDDDKHISLYLDALLKNEGYETRTFSHPKFAIEYADKCVPDAVIVDIMFPDSGVVGFSVVDKIRMVAGKRIPVIFISSRTDLDARASAVRVQGDAYFTKPLDFPSLNSRLYNLLKNVEKYKILIVDDDRELTRYHASILEANGFVTDIVNQPLDTLQHLENFVPDLVLMDMHMPDYNGIELATVIRQDDRHIGLPIVFLTNDDSKNTRRNAFNIGANEYLSKPVNPDQLFPILNKLIRNSRQLNETIKTITQREPVDGLHNKQYFLDQVTFSLTNKSRNGMQMSFLYIHLDNFNTIINNAGIEWISAIQQQSSLLLTSLLHKDDLLSQYSDSIYLVLASERTETEINELAKSILKKENSNIIQINNIDIRINFSIGIIRLNNEISSLHDLLLHAENASSKANKKGINQYVIKEVLTDNEQAKRDLSERINDGLKNNSFQLAYQPVISIDNRSHEMYEVLMRMIDKNGATIYPAQFLPVAHKNNQMLLIDRWVIDNALASLSSNKHTRSVTDLFVKISADSLSKNLLIPFISNSINEGGLTGESRVIFQIDEKIALSHRQEVICFSENIKKLNCNICLDHYGSTASSNDLLLTIKPDYVNIRGPVLTGILTDKKVKENVELLIKNAAEKNIKVIASHIEDTATLSMLWGKGVHYFQGYFIQQPDKKLDFNFIDSHPG